MRVEWGDLPVKKVRVVAGAVFDAYVFDTPGQYGMSGWPMEERMAHEIADAVEYRAVHATDSEQGDVLIACVDGGSGTAVNVEITTITDLPDEFTADDVENAVMGTVAWL